MKNKKIIISVLLLGAVGYYLWSKNSKKTTCATCNSITQPKPSTTSETM